jgi:hypothetical protein
MIDRKVFLRSCVRVGIASSLNPRHVTVAADGIPIRKGLS